MTTDPTVGNARPLGATRSMEGPVVGPYLLP
jgi:hypothetical protein